MKSLKLASIFAAMTLFVIACSNNQTTNINTNVNTVAAINSNAVAPNAAVPNAATTTAPDELAAAGKIYTEQCSKCHKDDGTGGVSDIDGKKIKAPNFASERMKNDHDSEWIEVIEHGAKEDGMPAYKGKISDTEIKKLVKYIRREFQGKQ